MCIKTYLPTSLLMVGLGVLVIKVMRSIWDSYVKVIWKNSLNQDFILIITSFNNNRSGASLVAQWLGVRLPMQGTRVRALVPEDPACRGAAGPVSHSCWACASGACAPQRERPRWWEARALRWGVAPTCRGWRKPSHRGEDPTQP